MLTRRRLINVLKAANQPVPEELLKFGTTVKKKEHGAYGAFYKDVDLTKKATKISVSGTTFAVHGDHELMPLQFD